MGCFAKGCLTVLVLGFFFLAAVGGIGWYVYKKTFNNLTSTGPADVRLEAPTPTQIESAEKSQTRLDEAIARKQETTVEFTGPEINYLLSRNTDLNFLRGRTRVEIADSVMTVALSAPLNRLRLPGTKGRWFNGTVRFSMTYANGDFEFELISAEAGGNEFPSSFLSAFNSAFSEAANTTFREELARNPRGSEFWKNVKSLSLQGDKLIITTKAE